ncbi:hypothetical protein KP509_01G026300 [Ceratopteris richardii]|nr:hypothetical protein KP509_01G026300 [Ceratopteris richardii]
MTDSRSSTSILSKSDQAEESTGLWSLGSLVKSLTLKSEGIIHAYRKDLEEFGIELKKETQMIAEVAAHAVKDLPMSLETGAFMAQEGIESVGQVVEELSSSVWRGTADLIAQGKEAVLRIEEERASGGGATSSPSSLSRYSSASVPIAGGKYSWFEAQVEAMQHDSSTYCDEPSDIVDYTSWKASFDLSQKKEYIETLLKENVFLQGLLLRFVPAVVSEDVFWTRYFYRLHKLQQMEEARADLVKRANALEEEDLTWDIEEEFEEGVGSTEPPSQKDGSEDMLPSQKLVEGSQGGSERLEPSKSKLGLPNQGQVSEGSGSKGNSKPSTEDEDDVGWDVPEDEESSSNDGKRSSMSDTSWEVPDVPRDEIRKRLAVQEDEEDLSWDIEDETK